MIDTIYVEEEIKNHPHTKEILGRFRDARVISCERYGEVFNSKAQNFRLQKIKPALILAKKFKNFVLETPKGYGIGGDRNYYFSHMMNCIYDCRYCFLQGMYESANYVVFVNYEDFEQAIDEKIKESKAKSYFFSGYDCDSLALESVTHFVERILPFFKKRPSAWLELRTKSIQIKPLSQMEPFQNCIVAYSLSPKEIAEKLEHKTPGLEQRIKAMNELAKQGWNIGLRFDPMIYQEHFLEGYQDLFKQVFDAVPMSQIHSVSLGAFRLPKEMFERMYKLYPDEKLFAGPLEERKKMVSYSEDREELMTGKIKSLLFDYISESIFFPCQI